MVDLSRGYKAGYMLTTCACHNSSDPGIHITRTNVVHVALVVLRIGEREIGRCGILEWAGGCGSPWRVLCGKVKVLERLFELFNILLFLGLCLPTIFPINASVEP